MKKNIFWVLAFIVALVVFNYFFWSMMPAKKVFVTFPYKGICQENAKSVEKYIEDFYPDFLAVDQGWIEANSFIYREYTDLLHKKYIITIEIIGCFSIRDENLKSLTIGQWREINFSEI